MTLQGIVTLSTIEAECVAITKATKEATWLKGLFEQLGFNLKIVKLTCDSQSGISLCKNQIHHEHTKHIDVSLHSIKDLLSKRWLGLGF